MIWRYFTKAREKVQTAKHEAAGVIFLTAAMLLMSACATSTIKPLDLTATLLMPEVQQKLPISVGIYYSPEFANYQKPLGLLVLQVRLSLAANESWSGLGIGQVPLGAASVQLFDQASRTLFAKAIPVSGRPPLGENPSIDGVIEPSIDAFEMQDFARSGVGKLRMGGGDFEWAYPAVARIRYRFVLYDRSGAAITSWVVIGDAAMLMLLGYRSDSVAVLVDAALQDAMRQFVQGFALNPEVKQWLARKKTQ